MDSAELKSPFKFLDAYEHADRDIFFGRETEIEALYELVLSTRLILVYGASGAGKTSLIRCGLSNKFSKADWFPISIRRGENMLKTLRGEINRLAITPLEENVNLSEAVESLYFDYYVPIHLIFDQFEELFIMGSREEQEAFFSQIAKLTMPQLYCKIIFSIREEYLAFLSNFEHIIPSLFDHRIRVERMSRKNLEQVVLGTCAAFDIELKDPRKRINDILSKLQRPNGVDLTNLQVYMDRLYRKDLQRRGQSMRPIIFDEALIDQTGALTNVLSEFLDEQLLNLDRQSPKPGMALDILFALVTNNGTKRTLEQEALVRKLAEEKGFSRSFLVESLSKLKAARILREWQEQPDGKNKGTITRIELSHDSLAGRIYDQVSIEEKNRRKIEQFLQERYAYYEKQKALLSKKDLNYINPYIDQLKLREQERIFIKKSRAAVNRRVRLTIGFVALFILTIAVFGLKARYEGRGFEALYLNAQAKQEAVTDPTLALRTTEKALHLRASPVITKDAYSLYRNHAFYQIVLQASAPLKILALSPQGDAFLTAAYQSDSLQLWSLEGKLLQTYSGHKHHVYAAAFSSDGTKIISGAADRNAILWNRNDGSILKTFGEHSRPIEAVALSPDGRWALTGSSDRTARFWRVETSAPVDTFYNYFPGPNNLAFSPDGLQMLIAYDNNQFSVHALNGDSLQSFIGHSGGINSLSFSADGRRLLSGSVDRTARLWEFGKATSIVTLRGHKDEINSAVFAPQTDLFQRPLILTASADGSARLWELKQDSLMLELRGHKAPIIQACFSPDGLSVLTASRDSTARLWQYPQKSPQRTYNWSNRAVYKLKYLKPGESVFSAAREPAPVLWRMPEGEMLQKFEAHKARTLALAVHSSDSLLFSGSLSGEVHIHRLNGLPTTLVQAHPEAINDIITGSDFLITASADSTLRRFNFQGDLLHTYRAHREAVKTAALAKSLDRFFSGGADSSVYSWDLNGQSKLLLEKLPGEVWSLAVSPDGKRLSIGLDEGSLIISDLKGKIKRRFQAHEGAISELNFSSNGAMLLSASKDKKVKLWTIDGHLIQSFINTDEASINTAVFSPDQKHILGGSAYGQVYLWLIPLDREAFLRSTH